MSINLTPPKYIRETFLQWVVTLLYSLVPIIVGTLVLFIDDNEYGFTASLTSQVERGELLLWAATLMSGVFYSTLKDPPVKWRAAFSFYCIAILLFAALYQAVSLLKSPQNGLLPVTYWVGIITSIVLLFNVALEQKAKENPSQKLHDESSKFADGYAKRRTQ